MINIAITAALVMQIPKQKQPHIALQSNNIMSGTQNHLFAKLRCLQSHLVLSLESNCFFFIKYFLFCDGINGQTHSRADEVIFPHLSEDFIV